VDIETVEEVERRGSCVDLNVVVQAQKATGFGFAGQRVESAPNTGQRDPEFFRLQNVSHSRAGYRLGLGVEGRDSDDDPPEYSKRQPATHCRYCSNRLWKHAMTFLPHYGRGYVLSSAWRGARP